MKYTCCIFTMFLLFSGIDSLAQLTTPEKPTLDYVTVDIESQNDIIVWYASPSAITDYYRVLTSAIVGPTEPPVVVEIGTVYIPDTRYENLNSESGLHSVGYSVLAVNDLGGGPLTIFKSLYSDPDSTIFLESVFDSCLASIELTWNDYNNWRDSIAEYNIYRRLGAGIYEKLTTLEEGTNSFVFTNMQVDQTYDLFVEAVNTDGRRSTSNRIIVFTQMTQQPGYINADYATISAGSFIDLSFTIDGASDLTRYNLMRSSSYTGPFVQIASFDTHDKQIRYTDEIPFRSGVYFYRLDVVNNCNQVSLGSNLGNNIILTGSLTGGSIALSWNEYKDWAGGVEQYRIIRTIGQENLEPDTLDIGLSTLFMEDISLLSNYEDPESSLICYTVLATENENVYGIKGKSLSNPICFSVNPDIRMPNAFIPNDGEPLNQVFEPVFSFLPEHYNLVIYNRLGTKVWEGSQAWDGRVNGRYVPEGVYLYYLRVYNYSSDIIELNGKVTVIYR